MKDKRRDISNQCDYCGAYIKIRTTNNFIHINIRQNPKTHYFCSKECKINWIFAPLEDKVKEVRI
jgi:YHS domain-containing protein